MLCHLPLLPLAGLALFVFLPFPVALALYLPILVVSALVGRAIVAAVRQPVQTGAEAMRGVEGVVVRAQGGRGLARLRGELWHVVAAEPLTPGARVIVEALEGITARVRAAPLTPTSRNPTPSSPNRAARRCHAPPAPP